MKKIYFNKLDYLIELNKELSIIDIEDKLVYRDVIINIMSIIEFSNNDKLLDLSKNAIIIYNPFDLSLNDKKMVNALYKKMSSHLDDEDQSMIAIIEKACLNLIEKLGIEIAPILEYSDSIDINKLFAAFNVCFKEYSKDEYYEILKAYINIVYEFMGIPLIICFGLLDYLTEEEKQSLIFELNKKDMFLVDIRYVGEHTSPTFTIASDYCII